MSWVRLEDGFTDNPKIAELGDKDFRCWVRLLCYCGRAKDPTVDEKTRRQVAGLTPARVARFHECGLLDVIGNSHEIHDWLKYQPKDMTNAERQARFRARKQAAGEPIPRYEPNTEWAATRRRVFDRDHGKCVDCGDVTENWNADHEPQRKVLEARGDSIYDLLFIFTRCHSCHSKKTMREQQKDVTQGVTQVGTPSRAGAFVPSPKDLKAFRDNRREEHEFPALREML